MRAGLRVAAAACALALVLTGLVGCSREDSSDTVVLGATAAPPTLDLTANNAAAIPQVLLYNVYETLLRVDDDGNLKPLLARSWSRSTDGLHYTFHLDDRARFASGARVDAAAVADSLNRMRSKDTIEVVSAQLAAVTAITARGDDTVDITLKQRDNFLLYNLAGVAGIIIDPAHRTDLARHPAGSGPYRVTGFSPGESVDLEASPAAWHERPQVARVRFSYYTDATSQTAALLSGDLDVITDLTTPQAVSRFSDPQRFTVTRGTTNGEVVLGLNNSTRALSDRRVRQAILMAIDRRGLLDVVWNGQGTLIGSMVPPTDSWYTDLSKRWPYDPAAARRLLAQAGYADGLRLRLRVPSLPYATASTRVITDMLKRIGITVVTDELEFPARWLDVVYTRADYDMTVVAHVEPHDIVNWANPDYYWRYRNPTFTRLIGQAASGPADQSTARMRQASEILADDAAGDFLYLMPKITVAKAGITGLQRNAASLSFDLTSLRRAGR
ncbi:ABC transporter substrate-binding protein [Acidipropionibacterium acidipropionici]|jgi:peptide/nickel transport system substrate-binding protein|uniref:ABC transporter substrate-binding protein n=1 Tax=Acidipropionibacterium acidipropionici TaxID=1748 RepID=A0AAC8YCT1_9ACTN|nr:ABC transporter substrate-binding protein [Acidipropionibacterium acidipropionici]AMS04342.1 ABC transporter substrate-binding protein [Acidipropionibacterium acidipropionici]AOZ45835.1 ABC transporter substrate-binding protein [Acidipropionibacterium acidipropionici]AZP38148.1 ABC transporter substrate-binding protein [Acidipropionibacterium acidipropionici]QCV94869.1 ABC transporter substrate-binding protein [Acidipropionibacterium acidipropionici]